MLMHEAEDAGMVVTDAEVDRLVDGLTQQQALGPRGLDGLRRQHGMVMPEIRRILHDYLLVRKNINRLGGAAAPSEPELRHYVLNT